MDDYFDSRLSACWLVFSTLWLKERDPMRSFDSNIANLLLSAKEAKGETRDAPMRRSESFKPPTSPSKSRIL